MLDFSVTFLFTIVNITFLYLVLRRFLFKPVTKFMEDRSNAIQNDLDHAKRAKARADELLAEVETRIKNAQVEGLSITQAAREKGEREGEAIIRAAREEASKIVQAARMTLEDERRHVARRLLEDTADLSIRAASQVISENMDSGKNRALVARFLESVGAP